MEQTSAAKHSADYRQRQKEAKQRLGIETLKIDLPAGTRSGISSAMKEHGYSQMQELWQDLALSFLSMPIEEQQRRLRKPDAPAFVVTHRLMRQFESASSDLLRANPGDDGQ